jgi:hypothetical protein
MTANKIPGIKIANSCKENINKLIFLLILFILNSFKTKLKKEKLVKKIALTNNKKYKLSCKNINL